MAVSREEIQAIVRRHHGAVLARLIRRLRSFDLAEDALQDALAAAMVQWPTSGIPESPRAWLLTAARNKAVDEIRKRSLRGAKHDEMAADASPDASVPSPEDEPAIGDDMLRLMFTCCHPALQLQAQIALTLHAIAGLSVEEIARAFLLPVPTLAQRLVRAKNKIRAAGIPYRVPESDELGPRTAGILRVVYLTFNEGYTATRGEQLVRAELCEHAIYLGRELVWLMPESADAVGLLALMLLQDSRRDARVDTDGEIVLLEEQDRGLWRQDRIQEGCDLTRRALKLSSHSVYPLQAAIAAVHAEASAPEKTDWRQIAALYDRLLAVEPTPVVALNRAVAVAMAFGPEVGLKLTEQLSDPLDTYYLFHAARGDLLRRAGKLDLSRVAFERALELCANTAEQRLLHRKLAQVSD